jgi:hypothetical protein
VTPDRLRRFDHRFQATVRCPEVPPLQERFGFRAVRVVPQARYGLSRM